MNNRPFIWPWLLPPFPLSPTPPDVLLRLKYTAAAYFLQAQQHKQQQRLQPQITQHNSDLVLSDLTVKPFNEELFTRSTCGKLSGFRRKGASSDWLSRFACSQCDKQFASSSALTKHKVIHSHVRRFACELCGKRFKRQDHLWVKWGKIILQIVWACSLT